MSTTNGTKPEYMSKKAALEYLGIKASTFFVACGRHTWLAEACTTEVHPETGTKWTKVRTDAIERYATERKAGGADHGGALKHALWLNEDEVAKAAAALTKALGREVAIDRMYKAKDKETA